MSPMSIDLVESSHRSEGTHGTLFCSTLVQEELRGLQVGEMLFSSCTAGSQAFAAFDQGFDVWLGNSRANPPRVHECESSLVCFAA